MAHSVVNLHILKKLLITIRTILLSTFNSPGLRWLYIFGCDYVWLVAWTNQAHFAKFNFMSLSIRCDTSFKPIAYPCVAYVCPSLK